MSLEKAALTYCSYCIAMMNMLVNYVILMHESYALGLFQYASW